MLDTCRALEWYNIRVILDHTRATYSVWTNVESSAVRRIIDLGLALADEASRKTAGKELRASLGEAKLKILSGRNAVQQAFGDMMKLKSLEGRLNHRKGLRQSSTLVFNGCLLIFSPSSCHHYF